MNDTTLLLLGGGALALYFLTRPVVSPIVPPPYPYPVSNPGAAAGYYPPAGMPTDPGDRNSWAPAIAAGVGALSGIINSAIKSSNSATSNGTYDDPYASSVSDGGWSDPFA